MARFFRQLGSDDPVEHHFVWAVIADGDCVFFCDDRVRIEHVETTLHYIQSLDNMQELTFDEALLELRGWAEGEAALRQIVEKVPAKDVYPCVICDRPLPSIDANYAQYRPEGGGEMRLFFSFGSSQFDESSGFTVFTGIVCDSCASDFVPRMQKSLFDLNGQPIQETGE